MTSFTALPRYFEIPQEPASLSFDDFYAQYFLPEKPVLIKQVGNDWPAKQKWTDNYVREQLSKEPSAKAASLWYWLEEGTLEQDYETPELVSQIIALQEIFPRNELMRIWSHKQGNVSSWHYDANMVNVFNVQVTGKKEWLLVSPETPLDCYPFTNFAIMKRDDESILRNKIFTKVELNAGDMLYVPSLWIHKVFSLGEENLSLNWIFTKKETDVTHPLLVRELERYALQSYLSKHRYAWVRKTFEHTNANIPGYLRWKWRYPEMIKTKHKMRTFSLLRRTFNELGRMIKMVPHLSLIRPYIDNLQTLKQLERKSQE